MSLPHLQWSLSTSTEAADPATEEPTTQSPPEEWQPEITGVEEEPTTDDLMTKMIVIQVKPVNRKTRASP